MGLLTVCFHIFWRILLIRLRLGSILVAGSEPVQKTQGNIAKDMEANLVFIISPIKQMLRIQIPGHKSDHDNNCRQEHFCHIHPNPTFPCKDYIIRREHLQGGIRFCRSLCKRKKMGCYNLRVKNQSSDTHTCGFELI